MEKAQFEFFVQNPKDTHTIMDAVEELIISDFTIAPVEMDMYRMMKKMARTIIH